MKAKRGLTKDGGLIEFPAYRDREFLLEYAIGRIVRLTASRDSEVALEAAKWLAEYADRLSRTHPAEEDRAVVIAELRALYAKALPKRAPLVVEVANDGTAEGQAGEARVENLPQVAAAAEETAEMREPEEERGECRMVPGRFPPQEGSAEVNRRSPGVISRPGFWAATRSLRWRIMLDSTRLQSHRS